MKNLSNLKSLAVLLLLGISIVSCKKDKVEPAPDLATRLSGIYVFSELAFDGKVIPADKSNLKGDIRITKKTETTVDAELDIQTRDDEEFMVYDVSDIKLVENGSTVELVYEGETVAKITGKKLVVNATDDTGTDFTLTATR
ncbi:hypothetical protein [Dyadobacter sp. CY343]|uniref:hypothetical protein n=1 Tax=Dyadobacter sp. CY343 TaxID=2907299 RepID=UPI001F289061|nr:hypothetical protein [Dyadobacter sp. CY343]MCE7062137.1 hypothetical protein [Dyadobacter sp. CY343]